MMENYTLSKLLTFFSSLMECKICHGATTRLFEGLFNDRYGYPGRFNVTQCSTCGFGQLEPQLTQEQLSDLYTNYYPRKNITVQNVRASTVTADRTQSDLKRKITSGMALLRSIAKIPITRWQDAAGKGDSFFVVLSK